MQYIIKLIMIFIVIMWMNSFFVLSNYDILIILKLYLCRVLWSL